MEWQQKAITKIEERPTGFKDLPSPADEEQFEKFASGVRFCYNRGRLVNGHI